MATIHVPGRCPACHTESLVLDGGDHDLLCEHPGCPAPTAAADLLEAVSA